VFTYHKGHKIPKLGEIVSKGQVGSSVLLSFRVNAVDLLKDVLLNFGVERQDDDAEEDGVCGGIITYTQSVFRL
jgi:hypothetical protein